MTWDWFLRGPMAAQSMALFLLTSSIDFSIVAEYRSVDSMTFAIHVQRCCWLRMCRHES